jgi:hypothetical protein
MLPQSAALEGLVADKLGGCTKRARPGLLPTRHSTFPRGDSEQLNRNVTRESGEKVTSPSKGLSIVDCLGIVDCRLLIDD